MQVEPDLGRGHDGLSSKGAREGFEERLNGALRKASPVPDP